MPKQWNTPGGTASAVCLDMLEQPHILIAGSTGSGKSVLINTLIYTALYKAPHRNSFILIDPKRVELIDYKELPHTLIYASEPPDIVTALNAAIDTMEGRYKQMQAERLKKSREGDIFVIVDEFADLMTTQKRQTMPQICRLAVVQLFIKLTLNNLPVFLHPDPYFSVLILFGFNPLDRVVQ